MLYLLTFLRNCHSIFQSNCTILHSYQQFLMILICAHPCQHFYYPSFGYCHPRECEVVSHCYFDLYFPCNKWHWDTFHVLVANLISFFGEMSIQIFCPFLIVLLSFYYWDMFLYIVDTSSLTDMLFANILSHLQIVLSFSWWWPLKPKVLNVDEVQLTSLVTCAFGIISRIQYLIQGHKDFCLTSSQIFKVLLLHLGLWFIFS